MSHNDGTRLGRECTFDPFVVLCFQFVEDLDTVIEELRRRLQLQFASVRERYKG